jgi:hypothetical protein
MRHEREKLVELWLRRGGRSHNVGAPLLICNEAEAMSTRDLVFEWAAALDEHPDLRADLMQCRELLPQVCGHYEFALQLLKGVVQDLVRQYVDPTRREAILNLLGNCSPPEQELVAAWPPCPAR